LTVHASGRSASVCIQKTHHESQAKHESQEKQRLIALQVPVIMVTTDAETKQSTRNKALETKQDKSTHGTHDNFSGKHGLNHLEQWACVQSGTISVSPSHGQLTTASWRSLPFLKRIALREAQQRKHESKPPFPHLLVDRAKGCPKICTW
jgi:hypothetical protein